MTKVEVTVLQQREVGNNLNIVAEVITSGVSKKRQFTVTKGLNSEDIIQAISKILKEEKENEKKFNVTPHFTVDI